MKKIFYNNNGNIYYILFGKQGERALLCNVNINQYVICAVLEENSWLYGSYFQDFEEAYEEWKKNQILGGNKNANR